MIISAQNEPIAAANYSDKALCSTSAVSWGAIFAGALTACALSLIMFILGTGLGFSAVSPWTAYGISAASLGLSAILWITFTQLLASGLGGYIAGRLRAKWLQTHTDEICFRDTAHGFLAWAIATFFMVTMVSSTLESLVKGGARATSAVVSAAGDAVSGATGALVQAGTSLANQTEVKQEMRYWMDSLFRKQRNVSDKKSGTAEMRESDMQSMRTASEVSRIFMNAIYYKTELSKKDLDYVTQIVSAQTEVSREEAQKRVTEIYSNIQANLRDAENAVREAADKSRKAIAYASLWITVSLLVGAFMASLAARWGGRHREAV